MQLFNDFLLSLQCNALFTHIDSFMKQIPRTTYLRQLLTWRDKQIIKVITGIRRSGKSTLMQQYMQQLQALGVNPEQIQFYNFEDLANEHLLDYRQLYTHVCQQLLPDKQNYVFFDEVQMVSEYQRAVDSLFLRSNVDIYLTGSNAYLLSSEITTLLSGRYIEIRLLPLSFAEYCYQSHLSAEENYRRYLSLTSFPYGLQLPHAESVREYLTGLYSTVVLKDIVSRRKLQDMDLLERIVRFLSDNIGSLTSVKSVTNNLQAGGRKVSDHTVEAYMQSLIECFLFYRIDRYDIRGKQRLKVGHKYYIADLGIRHLLIGIRNNDLGHLLENIVCLELLRRGYQVMIGKMGEAEVDFIALQSGQSTYFQVSLSVRDEATLQRELAPLRQINDHNPKYLLTLDPDPLVLHDGIRQLYALDWLLEK